MSWVHLEDACGLLLRAYENEEISGALNVTAPWPVKNREFTQTLAALLRRPVIFPAPAFVLRMIFREFSEELLGSRRVVPLKALESGYHFAFPQLEPALRRILHGT
jgi:NAD dependent epimerase/dehydratase family enzyme